MTDPKSPSDEGETPEDVATLYSWANLHGAKYRDFSASRAQAREEARKRVEDVQAAEDLRRKEEAERVVQEETQAAARLAAETAEAERQVEDQRLAAIAHQAEEERQAVLAAQEAQRQSAKQRGLQPFPEYSGAGHSVASANPVLNSGSGPASSPVFGSGSSSGVGQNLDPASAFAAPPQLSGLPVGGQPAFQAHGWPQAPAAQYQGHPYPASPGGYSDFSSPSYPEYGQEPYSPAGRQAEPRDAGSPRDQRDQLSRPEWLSTEPAAPRYSGASQFHASPSLHANSIPASNPMPNPVAGPAAPARDMSGQPVQSAYRAQYLPQNQGENPGHQRLSHAAPSVSQFGSPTGQYPMLGAAPVDDTLLGNRDRIANRWFALKSVFDPYPAPVDQMPAHSSVRAPSLAVFSLAGGVGKTSLVASLGRALSSRGEKVLLVDTASFGLLPFFFGARDQRPGTLRTFNPPGVSSDSPIQLVTLDADGQAAESGGPEWMMHEVGRFARAASRIVIDLPTASGSIARRVLKLGPTVLVPVVPDMSSVVSVGAIEAFFRHNANEAQTGGRPIMPYYVLNQFDDSLGLHLDVREILHEQIGDRLLPFALRRGPQVSEALAEGMTVMDYAPAAPVAEDYARLAGWVRGLSAPATQVHRGIRWSER